MQQRWKLALQRKYCLQVLQSQTVCEAKFQLRNIQNTVLLKIFDLSKFIIKVDKNKFINSFIDSSLLFWQLDSHRHFVENWVSNARFWHHRFCLIFVSNIKAITGLIELPLQFFKAIFLCNSNILKFQHVKSVNKNSSSTLILALNVSQLMCCAYTVWKVVLLWSFSRFTPTV